MMYVKYCVPRRLFYDVSYQGLELDDTFVVTPHYVGSNILICGRKKSHFPFQLFVSRMCFQTLRSDVPSGWTRLAMHACHIFLNSSAKHIIYHKCIYSIGCCRDCGDASVSHYTSLSLFVHGMFWSWNRLGRRQTTFRYRRGFKATRSDSGVSTMPRTSHF